MGETTTADTVLSAEDLRVLGLFIHRTFGHDRFTQDSPIRPDTWLAFWKNIAAAKSAGSKDTPLVDLIIKPMAGVEPGKIAIMLEKLLSPGDAKALAAFRNKRLLSYSRSAVYVRLSFDDLLKGVIPLTKWWSSILAGAEAQQTMLSSREPADVAPAPPDRLTLGKRFYNRVDARTRDISKDTKVDTIVQAEIAQFQLYRFGALASFTTRWLAIDPAEISQATMIKTARELSERGTTLESIKSLLPSFKTSLDMIDAGSVAREDVRSSLGKDARGAKGIDERLDPESILIHSVSRIRSGDLAVTRSRQAVKGDAAQNVFRVDTRGIAWAVIDSGIDATHSAFTPEAGPDLGLKLKASRIRATYDFTYVRLLTANGALPASPPGKMTDETWTKLRQRLQVEFKDTLHRIMRRRNAGDPLDWALLAPLIEVPHLADLYRQPGNEHGTHVAGIIAADWEKAPTRTQTQTFDGLYGVCPRLELYDLRVFDDEGRTDEDAIIHALEFVDYLNRKSPNQRLVHGVNISAAFGYQANAEGCGQTQLCRSCNELVSSGVVVVAAAGNFGFEGDRDSVSLRHTFRDSSITDPGNAEKVITVGSTHAENPHSYGVSYFSSRGPTADGRMKPDLVAPGEKIVSAIPGDGLKSLDGTSMAAPHVSGVAALLMARHRELIGQPERVKDILCRTATSLGRIPSFQGAGLVDALRALQSV